MSSPFKRLCKATLARIQTLIRTLQPEPMGLRKKIFLVLLLLSLLVTYSIGGWLVHHIGPQFLRIMEDGMVEHAFMLSQWIERDLAQHKDVNLRHVAHSDLAQVLRRVSHARIHAKIYESHKRSLDMRVYITDAQGLVVYDSELGHRVEGQDFRRWRDVHHALQGRYGARSSLTINRKGRTVDAMFTAFPLRLNGTLVGSLTLVRSKKALTRWAKTAQWNVIKGIFWGGVLVFLMTWLLAYILLRPIFRLTRYARDLTQHKRVQPPKAGKDEIGQLTTAFVEMKDALLQRQDVEHFVTQLTHELKSPLAAIQGAAELLEDPQMPQAQQQRFLQNIQEQTQRLSDLVQRLLAQFALEQREELEQKTIISVDTLLSEVVESFTCQAQQRKIHIQGPHIEAQHDPTSSPQIEGDRFLLFQALSNLLQNALRFTPTHGEIQIQVDLSTEQCIIQILDNGPGIPEYALPHVTERFYSLESPHSQQKGTGLGLPFVKEVALLHQGHFSISNREPHGVCATLNLALTKQTTLHFVTKQATIKD
ncbi:MAG: two-component system sensor histidine kinase CreC [Myxococcota bacterium]